MWRDIVSVLYLFLPAYVANMAPVVAKRLNLFGFLAVPLDGGTKLRGQYLFGAHKTARGIVLGVAAGALTGWTQKLVWQSGYFREITVMDFNDKNAIVWGMLLGCGALAGDLVKSFVKRRFAIEDGRPWIPWDQLDVAVGALVLSALYFRFTLSQVLYILILTPLLILAVNGIGKLLKIKEQI